MFLHSLRARIALAFVVLMLIAQAAAYLVINSVIVKNAHRGAEEQLTVAERVFGQVIRGNSEQLTQAATVVAADFGFREAVASHDGKTVASALENHGDRIHADIVMLVGLAGKLIADSAGTDHAGSTFPFPALIKTVAKRGDASSFGMIGGRAYQLVAVPVKAPITIAWVVMGFAIDDALAREMSTITSLDVSFLTVDAGGKWGVLASSLSDYARATLKDQNQLADEGFVTRLVPLHSEGRTVAVLLERSLIEALAPYHRLQSTLLIITILGVLVSIIVSVLTARSVTRPIAALAAFSTRIGQGEYAEPLEVRHQDEIGQLAHAFNQMQEGIVERERRITELAYMDRLTGLPNRALFNDRLQQALASAMRTNKPLAVMMMDLDRFKYVNDTLGHPIGDMLLCEVAKRLRATLQRQTDTVARLGGDEFAVLLPTDNIDAARLLATRMLRALEQPITIENQLVDVGASIGIVTFPDNGTDMNVLLRRADIAMYVAKRSNLGFSLYDERHDQNSAERLSLMSELRQAVEHNQLTLYYQPKVDLATHRVKYVEALVRWDHPTRGFVAPDQFIPFAEQTGYIKTISRWVADKAIGQCAEWRAQGLDIEVSVNVSARELIQSSLPETFQGLLEKHGVKPAWIWIEITESAIMDDPNHAIETLDRLHALGIRLSIDDFGTGYSSLSYLKRMPVDEIKIDKSFVMGMADHKDDETIVRLTIDLGHNMGLKVVAEGVENEEMLMRLKELQCDLAQGFHLSRPLPPARLELWLNGWKAQNAVAEHQAREQHVVAQQA
ncbi:EAL domain-containing protein [Caballeronia sp. BR00000012568055]|uniref:putative bifunctional diguanylate cyclase/phosphodiesterase n=1 Tax=Caballeronia sp. BR00000012568055 TaxID=2918761 RepID=UPI0023F97765|nr:EAL domain-containing protein [Caballeronia sp. BR00000012568055]